MVTKVIKEIITDVGGNTTIEYSDDTTQKYNVADVVTAQSNPVTGGISFPAAGGGFLPLAGARLSKPLYFNRFMHERPCAQTFSGIAGYTRGNILLSVSTVAGSNQITWTGGNPVADVGSLAWMGVIYQNGVYSTIIVSSTSGNVMTVAEPMQLTGSGVISSYHEGANGIHLSPFGGRAMADMLFYCDPISLSGDMQASYDVDSVQGTWYSTPWIAPYNSPQYWKQSGGLANNALGAGYIPNPFNSSSVFFADGSAAAGATAAGVGQGITLTVPISGAGVVSFSCGHSSTETPRRFAVTVAVDGVTVFTGLQSAAIKGYRVLFPAGASLTINAAATVADATNIAVNRVSVLAVPSALRKAIEQGDKVMVVGDSWTEEGVLNRPEFVEQLRYRAESIGATVLPSYGIGGTKAGDALAVVNGVRNIDAWIAASSNPTVCVIHYYLNDHTASVSARQWAANVTEIIRTCIASNITPLVMLPGCVASQSKTKDMMQAYGRALGAPVCIADSVNEVLISELQDKTNFINTVRKRAGRVAYVASIPATYIARSSTNTSVWDCITAGATPATVTPV